VSQFWESILDSGANDQAVGNRFFQVFSRLFGLSGPAIGGTAADQPVHEAGPVIRFVRPQFDAVATAAAAILPDDDVQLQFGIAMARTTPAGPDPILTGDGSGEQSMTVVLDSIAQPSFRIDDVATIGTRIGTPQYAAVVSDLDGTGYVYDTRTKELLPGGPGDYPQLFGGSDLKVMLSGDYSAGAILETGTRSVDSIELLAGNSYSLIAPDDLVQAGQILNVSAATLGEGDHFLFDGSAETDGMYFILGSDGGDVIIGGAGDDRFYGLDGADALAGGGGSDIFMYGNAGESSGTNYDTIADFNPVEDRIDLPGAVAGFGAAIEGGALSTATFNADLSAALGDLAPSQAVWFAPDQGDLAGQIFLIVDGNGQAGYQEGEDFVIAVEGAPLADLTGNTDIFI
jgi:Ca2+-binding RTX toxin-like protein